MDPGQTEFDYKDNDLGNHIEQLHNNQYYPPVASVRGDWLPNNCIPYSALLITLVALIANLHSANVKWNGYVDMLRAGGMSIVMPIYNLTDNERTNPTLLNIYSWTHDPYPEILSLITS